MCAAQSRRRGAHGIKHPTCTHTSNDDHNSQAPKRHLTSVCFFAVTTPPPLSPPVNRPRHARVAHAPAITVSMHSCKFWRRRRVHLIRCMVDGSRVFCAVCAVWNVCPVAGCCSPACVMSTVPTYLTSNTSKTVTNPHS